MTDGPNSAFPAATQQLGKAYSPDDICALAEGDGSFVCRVCKNSTKIHRSIIGPVKQSFLA